MTTRRRDVGVPTLLAGAAYVLAFLQRPGLQSADTKINLHVAAGRFLHDAAATWAPSGQLGGVQSGQQVGYLFPMGPFFAVGHALGIADWVLQRLWLGTLIALAAVGTVRLLRALLPAGGAVAALTAGTAVMLNPFVVTYANRTTVTLLAYAALPWLLLAVHRGLRQARGWRWPAAAALIVAAAGGGVNGAVLAWMLLGPVLLALYELGWGGVGRRALGQFALRSVVLGGLVSLWWLVPAWIQAAYGNDFLHFTEQPGSVWGTTSATESLRLMSFWLSYVGIGFGGRAIPYFDDAGTLLFSLPVVLASLLGPAAALTGFVWTRRWRYGPFCLALVLAGLLVMMAGFPEGTPLRHGLYFTYNHLASVRFLRASYKAAPLVAIGLACLAGAAAAELWSRLRTRRRPGVARAALAGAALVLPALAAWPLITGRAQDRQVSFASVPAAWRHVAADLDRGLPVNSRALVLPGELFSFYTWGGTVDPILPALTRRPVAIRSEVPYTDPRATDLLWTLDGLVHQQRLLPGQLRPLLALIGVRAVITATDDDPARSDAPSPVAAARQLAGPGALPPATTAYGPQRTFTDPVSGAAVRLPEIRRYDLPASDGIIHVEPRADPVLLDGSATAIAELAAFGALAPDRAIRYAGDLDPAALRAAARAGATVVLSDANRRAAFVAGSLEQNAGWVLSAGRDVSADGIIADPVGRGAADQTTAVYSGIRDVWAPFSPERPQHPEHRPFAALDGDPATAWLADPTLDPGRRYLEVDLRAPRPVRSVELLPSPGTEAVAIGGRRFALRPGWNRLAVGLRSVSSLRVGIAATAPSAGAGGIAELRIPGITASETLALPAGPARALAGTDLHHDDLEFLFSRVTGDRPYVRGTGAGEAVMHRSFTVPASRSFAVRAWASLPPGARTPDAGCGAVAVRVDGRLVRMALSGAAPRAGEALRVRACGPPLRLAAGPHHLDVMPGALVVEDLRLSSPAPAPPAQPETAPRLLSAGHGSATAVTGVRIGVSAPAWLVLGQGYNRGWRASCDGHALGAPVAIDGYANGWPVDAGCRSVSLDFAPQRAADASYVLSAVAALICLLLLLRLAWRPGPVVAPPASPAPFADVRPRPVRLGRAALPALVVAAAVGFLCGARAGVVSWPLLVLVLWRGVGVRALSVVAGALLGVVVPLLYALHPVASAGGNHSGYALAHLDAHWVALTGLGLLGLALWRTLAAQGARRR